MIDIVFLLLVFFVCTANFTEPEKNLPMNVSADGNVKENITPSPLERLDIVRVQIAYQDTPHWIVEANDCQTIQEVRNILLRLKNVQPDIPVIIEPDANVPMEHVIDIYDICRNLGLTNIRFAAG
jgi:biopolymer transport protein ExbD